MAKLSPAEGSSTAHFHPECKLHLHINKNKYERLENNMNTIKSDFKH